MFGDETLKEDKTLSESGVKESSDLALRRRAITTRKKDYLGKAKLVAASPQSMAMGAGGQIQQKVYEDKHLPDFWDPSRATSINLHLLDSVSFEEVTGLAAPPTPVSMETYVSYGYPMFALADEHKDAISAEGGAFKDVKSVSEIDTTRGVSSGGEFDPNKPQACARCETQLREIL